MIHPELKPNDGQPGLDHFRSDSFRPLLDLCYATPPDGDERPVLPETTRNGHLIFDRQRCLAVLDYADAGHRMLFLHILKATVDCLVCIRQIVSEIVIARLTFIQTMCGQAPRGIDVEYPLIHGCMLVAQ